jgi:hypothetical protein
MSATVPSLSWTDANQRLLVAEFGRLRARLAAHGDSTHAAVELTVAGASMPAPAAIDQVSQAFGLSAFERDLLLLCAGAEMDAQLASLCTAATGEGRRQGPTFAIALGAFEEPHWSALAPVRPLRRWRLIEVDGASGGAGLAQARLRIDERVLHYLAGVNYLDTRLRSLLTDVPSPSLMAPSHRAMCDEAARWLAQSEAPDVVFQLTGDDPLGQIDVAARIAEASDRAPFLLRAEDVPSGHDELDALLTLLDREAALLGAAWIVSSDDALPRQARRLVERLRGLVVVTGPQVHALDRASKRLGVGKPEPAEQKSLWQTALGPGAAALDGALDGVAGQFRLSARRIESEGGQLAPALAAATVAPDRLVWAACRTMGRSKLDELAQRIDVAAAWDDLILPPAQKATLREIASHVRHRLTVYVDWGFAEKSARGLGISALFAGESGTGKTMAAEVLAGDLQLDVYRIDLSSVVSKYIGETEKNLRRVFDAAEESGAILLFDEADALFGKRSEVKDSHDRYANIEVSYLLQRMETYRGLCILTSNLKASLDVAFQRRLRFIVQFPFPDLQQREAIWRTSFPPRTPLGHVDYASLAKVNMAGGHIRNIALNAAFGAAEAGEAVSMRHLLQAAHLEASKRERPLSESEIRGWV